MLLKRYEHIAASNVLTRGARVGGDIGAGDSGSQGDLLGIEKGSIIIEVDGQSFEGGVLSGSEAHAPWNLQQTADVKFKVSSDMQSCKVGYHDVKDDPTKLVSYIDKKSSKLKLTGVLGAGLFYMPIPSKYTALDNPAKASETSLKHSLRHMHL